MKAEKTYYGVQSILAFCCYMTFTAAAVYRINIVQLSAYQLILLGVALETAILLFEIPTGIVADLKSRKLSVMIGFVIVGVGFLIEAIFPYFIAIFMAQIIWGIGYTFISGALDAWVSDEVVDKELETIFLTGYQYSSLFNVLGIGAAIIIGSIHVRLALVVPALVLIVMGIWMKKYMKETNFKPTKHESLSWRKYIKQFGNGMKHIKNNNVLFILLFVFIAYGLYSEGIDRLYELHLLKNYQLDIFLGMKPIVAIGLVNGMVAILGIGLLRFVKRYTKDSKRSVVFLLGMTLFMMLGIGGFALSPSFIVGIGSFMVFAITRQGTAPLLNAICLQQSPSNIKATVLSSFSQLDAVGQLVSGFLMATISGMLGIRWALLVTIVILGLAIYPLVQLKKRVKDM